MTQHNTKKQLTLQVEVHPQCMAIFMTKQSMDALSEMYGVVYCGREMPYHSGMTLIGKRASATGSQTFMMKPFVAGNNQCIPSAVLSPVRRVQCGNGHRLCLAFPNVTTASCCARMSVLFEFSPTAVSFRLPDNHKRPWPPKPSPTWIFEARSVALREIDIRTKSMAPKKMCLKDLPGWAQGCLTTEERVSLHSRGRI